MLNNDFISGILSKLKKSEFSKNVLTLMTGTAIAQVIPLLLAPVLSRIYSPEDFGRLALYLSIVQLLGVIANGRYELAIVLPKTRKEGVQITLLAIIISIVVSLIALISVIFFSAKIAFYLGDPKLEKWLYLVPLSVLMMGVFNALNYFNTREKAFKNIARANVFKAFGGSISQLFFGIIKFTNGGLIIGQSLSHFFGNVKMIKTFLFNKEVLKTTSFNDLKKLGLRYIDFPKFSLWGIFLNSFSNNMVNLFVSNLYGLLTLGQYSFAYKYLGMPASLIGNSISQVYLQKISEYRVEKSAVELFKKTLIRLFIISLIVFCPLYFIVEDIYVFVFGEEWKLAGVYAKPLIILFSVKFMTVPFSITFSVFEKQKESFFWNVALLILSLLLLNTSNIFLLNFLDFIYLYVSALSLYYIFMVIRVYFLIKK